MGNRWILRQSITTSDILGHPLAIANLALVRRDASGLSCYVRR